MSNVEPEITTEDLVIDSMNQEEINSKGGVPVGQQLMLVGGILLLIFGSAITPQITNLVKKDEVVTKPVHNMTPEENTQVEQPAIKPFSEVDIVGYSAYVWDINAQRALYKKNETEVLPLASVTKLMTALLADEILNENDKIVIPEVALNQDGDSGLLRDETFNRLSLSDLVLMSSSNDGAYALAVSAGEKLVPFSGANAFVSAMNVRADELGLNNTTFHNPTGLDLNQNQAGAYGTAKDVSFLMEHIVDYNPDLLSFTKEDDAIIASQDGFTHEASNTNYYIDEIPGLIGSKTGYTDLAGGNLVIAYDAGLNRPIVITVLGSTQSNRFTDVMKLVEETNNYLAQE